MFKTELKSYQKEGVQFALSPLNSKYTVNADDMGLGKSLTALKVSEELGPTLITSPAYLGLNWVKEIQKHTEFKWKFINSSNFRDPFDSKIKYYISSYESVKYVEYIKKNFKFCIWDEAHYLKNPRSSRTEISFGLLEDIRPEFSMLLTGTPIKNRVYDYYSLLLMCSSHPNYKGKKVTDYCQSFDHFKMLFCEGFWNEDLREMVYKGVKNVPILRDLIKDKVIRRETSSVLDLPKFIEDEIIVDYKESPELQVVWELHKSGECTEKEHITRVKVANALAKVPFTIKVVKDLLDYRDHVVVFSDHVEPAIKIAEEFGWPLITGKVSPKKRFEINAAFQRGEIQGVSATIGSASTGLDFTKSVEVIFNDLPWCQTDVDQARKRIHRIGQEYTCFSRYITGSKFDRTITKMLISKSRDADSVYGTNDGKDMSWMLL